jgi:single-strand DNA-binding protein
MPVTRLRRSRILADMDETGEWANEVRLVGRVSGEVSERELPSGDRLVALRVVVPRPARAGGGAVTVDTIDVACWGGRVRQSARRLTSGETVEVSGALRRRFFRAGAATASRYEVEAASLRRIR